MAAEEFIDEDFGYSGTKIVDSGISIVPEYTLSDRVLRESSVSHTDQKRRKYTEAEVDSIIEAEETKEREKVHMEYAAQLEDLRKEFAEMKHNHQMSIEEEDMQVLLKLNFLSDSSINGLELLKYKKLLSEFDEFKIEVTESHEQLEHTTFPESPDRIHSLQSLSSSFVDLQQRYKQLRDECSQKVQALEEALQSKSRLEKMNEEMKTRFQTILEDTSHDINRANVEYSTLEKKLASDLALEKATAKKLEVEAASVEKTLQQMEQEKLQLTQLCEELMKQLGHC